MLEKMMKELGVIFCGEWKELNGFLFQIDNAQYAANGTTFISYGMDKESVLKGMTKAEIRWVNVQYTDMKGGN